MERIRSINRERIAWCCADNGITIEALAAEVGIGQATIDKAMSGEDGLTFMQLRRIADYFGRGLLFFLEEGPATTEQVHTPAFRTLANQKPEMSAKLKNLIERVEKQREIYLSLREDLDDGDVNAFNPPLLPGDDIKEAARITRDWLKIQAANTFDSYRAAVEARGVLVFRSNGYNGKWQIAKETPILGFALYDAKCPAILVKKSPWESVQSFTLMHELAHILLHKESSIDDERDFQSHKGQERAANAFAGLVLVPDHFLAAIKDADKPADVANFDRWLHGETRAWGISSEVILRRLLDVGRLSQAEYTAYRAWRNQNAVALEGGGNRMYRHREPKHIFGDAFVRAVFDSLSARHITLSKASSYLDGLKIRDLHQLERHLANG